MDLEITSGNVVRRRWTVAVSVKWGRNERGISEGRPAASVSGYRGPHVHWGEFFTN